MLIKNAKFIVTQNPEREILEKKDIIVEGGRIKKIGEDLNYDGEDFDASEKIVAPGLINCHSHSPLALFRGTSDKKGLDEWLQEDIMPREEVLTKNQVYHGSLLSLMEKVATGTTTFCEMYSYNDTIIKAIKRIGIRAFVSCGLKDSGEKNIGEIIEKQKNTLQRIKEDESELVKPALGLHWSLTCSDSLIKEVIDLDDNLPIFMHISENEKEVIKNLEKYDKRPVERLENIGALNENFIAVHAVQVSDEEIEALADNNCKVVHNPTSNMKLADGVIPLKKMKEKGICVSLGTDSVASNDNMNLFEEMKIASLLQKVDKMDPSLLDAQETFDMVTTNASAICKEGMIGSIEEGNYADMIFIDVENKSLNPALKKETVLKNLVYAFDGNVNDVMVNGNFIMKNRTFINLDQKEIYQKVKEFSKEEE